MGNLQFNTKNVRRNPINRNNLFYDENSFQYEMTIAKNYIEQDLNQTLVLFEVDLNKTNLNNEYKEAESYGVMFKTPVEIHCMYNIQQGEMASYDKTKNMGVHIKPGKLNFNVMESTLSELGCDIKIGDYIGVQVTPTHMEYYVVTNDGRNNYDNKHMVYGYKPSMRSCTAAAVADETEFKY